MENHWVAVLSQEFPDILGHWTLCFIDVQMKNTKRPFVGPFWMNCTLKGLQYGSVNSLTLWLWGRN